MIKDEWWSHAVHNIKLLVTSVAVLAEIPLRSPQKIFVFIIKKYICWVKESKNKIILFWKKTSPTLIQKMLYVEYDQMIFGVA